MKLRSQYFFFVTLIVFAVSDAQAASFNNANQLTSVEFANLSKDLGATLSQKSNGPAYNLGLTGFEVGTSIAWEKISHGAIYDRANSANKSSDGAVMTKSFYAVKGLPFGVDVGASLRSSGGYDTIGVNARYALLQGGVALPSVVLRAAHTRSVDSDVLKFAANSVDASISKGILFLVPYAGVGNVWATTSATGLSASNTQSRVFAGINANFLLMTLGYEYDKTGEVASQALKLSVKW